MNKEEAFIWLKENSNLVVNNLKLTLPTIHLIYSVYNAITGENKRYTGCSKCLKNVLDRLRIEYKRIENKELRFIYRNNFGYLTLSETKNLVYSIWVLDDNDLNLKLDYYKKMEKMTNK